MTNTAPEIKAPTPDQYEVIGRQFVALATSLQGLFGNTPVPAQMPQLLLVPPTTAPPPAPTPITESTAVLELDDVVEPAPSVSPAGSPGYAAPRYVTFEQAGMMLGLYNGQIYSYTKEHEITPQGFTLTKLIAALLADMQYREGDPPVILTPENLGGAFVSDRQYALLTGLPYKAVRKALVSKEITHVRINNSNALIPFTHVHIASDKVNILPHNLYFHLYCTVRSDLKLGNAYLNAAPCFRQHFTHGKGTPSVGPRWDKLEVLAKHPDCPLPLTGDKVFTTKAREWLALTNPKLLAKIDTSANFGIFIKQVFNTYHVK